MNSLLTFIVHLRLHYQFFILSGGFLLGGFLANGGFNFDFWKHFFIIHILLFGGATAFNSFWDKDEGPIGGLKNPPKMQEWMRWMSLVFMGLGGILSLEMGLVYVVTYVISMFLFWAYSSPVLRWKGDPILSLFVIGLSTGTAGYLFGYISGGGQEFDIPIVFGSAGVAFVLVSMYPISQIFQIEEDRKRGDETFASRFGKNGVLWCLRILYPLGLGLLFWPLWLRNPVFAALIFSGGSLGFAYTLNTLTFLKGEPSEYEKVMRLKYAASMSFVLVLLAGLFVG